MIFFFCVVILKWNLYSVSVLAFIFKEVLESFLFLKGSKFEHCVQVYLVCKLFSQYMFIFSILLIPLLLLQEKT